MDAQLKISLKALTGHLFVAVVGSIRCSRNEKNSYGESSTLFPPSVKIPIKGLGFPIRSAGDGELVKDVVAGAGFLRHYRE